VAIRAQRWIDHTGLNLIRIVIGSYFMAIALGLIEGTDPKAMFIAYMDHETSDLVGTMLLFAITTAFMAGLFLRQSSLMLAIFIMGSSLAENFLSYQPGSVSNFWRDITMVCAVLLSYSCLRRSELRKANVIGRPRLFSSTQQSGDILPRRVVTTTRNTAKRPKPSAYHETLTPLLRPTPDSAPIEPAHEPGSTTEAPAFRRRKTSEEPQIDDDCENIFNAL
jgi:hypothetical protein